VRVKADEDGVEAAAYTVIMVKATSAMPEEPIEFTVDRPFIFEIISSEGLPLFTGVVNHLK
ncbi:MAG: serpin family protein, partial [Firmicutes bacterium]|nr:serpin family protein [Bacillota bacterium]